MPGHQYSGRAIHHYLMENQRSTSLLHVRSTDAGTIGEALQSFLQQKQLDPRKLIGQGYDGAATFPGKIVKFISEFRNEIYLHCSCHRLQLASIQAATSVKEIGGFLEPSKLFYYSPKKQKQ